MVLVSLKSRGNCSADLLPHQTLIPMTARPNAEPSPRGGMFDECFREVVSSRQIWFHSQLLHRQEATKLLTNEGRGWSQLNNEYSRILGAHCAEKRCYNAITPVPPRLKEMGNMWRSWAPEGGNHL